MKFTTRIFFLPRLKPNLVHSNTEEDVAAARSIGRSDKQQDEAHVAEAGTQTHTRACTQRTSTRLATEHWFYSTSINISGSCKYEHKQHRVVPLSSGLGSRFTGECTLHFNPNYLDLQAHYSHRSLTLFKSA